jgi:phosphatidylglycerophosphate synthase
MNYTPNGITTLSLIFSSAGLYHLYNHDMVPFTIYILFAQLFDDMDGFYARKYKMVSEEGDKYDHYKDLSVFITSLYILYSKYNILNFPVLLLMMCTLGVLGTMFFGCQEKLTSLKNRSNTLSFAFNMSPKKENCKSSMKYLRYFGAGSLSIVFILMAWYLDNAELNSYESLNNGSMNSLSDTCRPYRIFEPTSQIHEMLMYQQPNYRRF